MCKVKFLISLLSFGILRAEIKIDSTIRFTENLGQVCDQNGNPRSDVLFGGRSNNMCFHLRSNGISYQLIKPFTRKTDLIKNYKEGVATFTSEINRIDLTWIGSKKPSLCYGEFSAQETSNYYLNSCPNGIIGVKSYSQVRYKEIYDLIDVRWYTKDGKIKYDYELKAGADHKKIKILISGSKKIRIGRAGELIIETELGQIIEEAPLVLQCKKVLSSKWVVNNNIISIDIKGIDHTQPFIIDPLVRNWGTYYGDLADETGQGSCIDANGDIYITGRTASTGSILATVGSHQQVYSGGVYDAYLLKFSPSGTRIWSTYYGGDQTDEAYSCRTDNLGNVYMVGLTASSSVIATPGCHQFNYAGGPVDGFLVKFNSMGLRLWGTYYGGNSQEYVYSVTTNTIGEVYIGGTTSSTNNFTSPGAFQTNYMGGFTDGYIAKFSSAGTRLWGSYIGDYDNEEALCVCLNTQGELFVSGSSNSYTSNIIATPGCYQSMIGGTIDDAYLVKFSSSGTRIWGTYYGGTGGEGGNSCVTDSNDNIYLCGGTSTSGTLLSTSGSHQVTHGGNTDGFLVKFNTNGVRQWATYYGGGGVDIPWSITTDAASNVYMSGNCTTTTFSCFVTSGGWQWSHGGGNKDAFLVKFNSAGVRLYGTFYGGSGEEEGFNVMIDNVGRVYMVGNSDSAWGTNVASPGSYQPALSGGDDAFIVQFEDCPPAPPVNITPNVNMNLCSVSSATLIAAGSGTITWYSSPTSSLVLNTGSVFVTPTLAVGTHSYYVAATTCTQSATRTLLTVTVNNTPTVNTLASPTAICVGETTTLSANGAVSYSWYPGVLSGSLTIVSPTISTNYTVLGIDANGCVASSTCAVTVNLCTGFEIQRENFSNVFLIYPIPFLDQITVRINSDEIKLVQVFNCTGALVGSFKINESVSQINLHELDKGIYFVRAGTSSIKVIKE